MSTNGKSVTGDTRIIILENGRSKCVEIGPWIDEIIKKKEADVRHEVQTGRNTGKQLDMELADIQDTKIYTCDSDGNVTWEDITVAVRHDHENILYKVKTYSGREVTVPDTKSLLIWRNDKFEQVVTSEAKVGDYMPVAQYIPPIETTKVVNVCDYLPKTEYLYVDEYNKAVECMRQAMEGRERIKEGWWEKSSGTLFTLPYERKSRLQRATHRSIDISTEHGKVFPFKGSRYIGIPAVFELNEENGIFFGLYAAEGNYDPDSGSVNLSNNDMGVREYIEKWFHKNGINTGTHTKITEGKTKMRESTTVSGYSTVLGEFFDQWLGHGSKNKKLPDEIYTAPEEFVRGFINGYVSGDGGIENYSSINFSSVSEQLIDGMSWILTRFGVIGRKTIKYVKHENGISKNFKYSINGKWARKFAQQISLMIGYKQTQLLHILNKKQRNIKSKYESVNDVIKDLIISIEPVYSTAQEKLYDLTVPKTLNFGLMNCLNVADTSDTGYTSRRLVKALEDISVRYDNTVRNSKGTIIEFLYGEDGLDASYLENVTIPILKYTYNELKSLFDTEEEFQHLVELWRSTAPKREDNYCPMPINIQRILSYAKTIPSTSGPVRDVFSHVKKLTERILNLFNPSQSVHGQEAAKNATLILRTYIHFELMYKRIEHVLTHDQFLYVIEDIETQIRRAMAIPGEMCGILAAQSIGEPTTQLTLNSVEYNTQLVIDWTGPNKPVVSPNECAGKFIDHLIEVYKDRCELQPDGVTIYLPLPKGSAQALSIDSDGKSMWTELEAVTRHPPINADGSNTLVKITTQSGRTVTCTKAKSFLVYDPITTRIEPIDGVGLLVGMYIPIIEYSLLDREYYDYDIIYHPEELMDNCKHCKQKEDDDDDMDCEYCDNIMGLRTYYKLQREEMLMNAKHYKNSIWTDKIVSIENVVSKHPFVYDLTVEKTRNMTTRDGICLRDTFHYAGVSDKNVTLGIPRLKELINVTKKLKTPSLTMYEDGSVNQYSESGQKRLIESLRSRLEYKTLHDIIQSSDIVRADEKEFESDNDIIDIYRDLFSVTDNILSDDFLSLRLSFLPADLEYTDITMYEICKLIEMNINGDVKVICSDDNDPNLFIRIIIFDDDDETIITNLRKIEIICMGMKLKGYEGIDRVLTRKTTVSRWSEEKGHHKVSQWILETEGTNLVGTMELQGIDHTRTVSNSVLEMYEVFGIESARTTLLNELKHVLSFDGSYINYRHLAILVDAMTCRGSITAMTRHGINRIGDVGPLTKCSFEETVEIVTDAAAFSETDHLLGISDNIMVGQLIPAGTGSFSVLYDHTMKPFTSENEVIKSTPVVTKKLYIPSEPLYDPLSNYTI